MGEINLDNTGSGSSVTLSSDGTSLLLDGTAVGGSALELYAENTSSHTSPTASGANAVAIGNGTTASGEMSIGLGRNAVASGQYSFAGGNVATATHTSSLAIGAATDALATAANAIGFAAQATADYATAIGQARAAGINSFAAAITNNTSTYGATGANSIAMGIQAKASSARGVAIGAYATSSSTSIALSTGWNNITTTASGSNSVAIGGNTSATSPGSYAFGQQSSSAIRGKYAYAAGRFAANGDAQGGQFILRCSTTDATPTLLRTNGDPADAGNQIVALSDTCITFDGTITAMQNGAQSYASWRVEGLLVNDGGTTTVANSAITVIDNQSSWGLTLTADNGNSALAITFTGEAAHNIRTVANIRTSEVTYA